MCPRIPTGALALALNGGKVLSWIASDDLSPEMEAGIHVAKTRRSGPFMSKIPIHGDSQAELFHRFQLLSLKAERQGDLRLAARILELAARERHVLPGGEESMADLALPILTPEQARVELEQFLREYESFSAAEASSPATRA